MNYKELREDNNFHKWNEYEPTDTHYVLFADSAPSVIAAGHKIGDVYHTFANAKQSFMSAGYNDYGELCEDTDISKLYIKTHFLLHAVIEYAICLDLSWQVMWAYVQPASFEYLVTQEYMKMEKECDRDNLIAQLDCAIAQKSMQAQRLKKLMISFDKDKDVMTLRALYNSLKHRGIIHFDGLGTNDICMMMSVEKNSILKLHRKSYKIEEVESILYAYHQKFQKYFNKIIEEIMPIDYFATRVSFSDYVETMLAMDKIQNEK